jgi:DNA-binding Lrp family transcriptional regulator
MQKVISYFVEDIVEKLDLKDRKILYHLDIDSRQSFRSLGKKVGLSKDVVASRVKKLQEKGIIKGFYAMADYFKIGYSVSRFYFSFQNVKTELKKEIIEFFLKENHVVAVKSLEGNYDLLVGVMVKNYPQAQSFWQNTLKNYGKYFSKRVFNPFSQEDAYAFRILLDEKNITPLRIYHCLDTGERVEIDELDFNIIKLLTENARMSTIDMANELNSTSTVIHYRLKKLMDSNIIIAFRLHIDFTKLGYYVYKVDIELNQFDKMEDILRYIKSLPNLFCIMKTIGYVDLEITFLLNNSYQLNQIMEDLSSKFPDVIKDYSYYIGIKTYTDYAPK